MSYRLLVSRGPDAGCVFTLNEGLTRLGRGSSSNVKLTDRRVSRNHCIFQLNHGSLEVEDVNSTGGTLVNGRPIDRTTLRPGDSLNVGDSVLSLFFDDASHSP